MDRKVLLAAIAVTVAGAALLYMHQKRFEEETMGGEPAAVLMATQDIPAGTLLSKAMLGVRKLPQRYVEGRHILASDAQRILGVRMQQSIKANSSILWTDVSSGGPGRRDLSTLIKAGMRAITIRADSTPAEVGLLRPGDRVDVLMTSDGGPKGGRVTVPLLQNVLVLAVGRSTGEGTDGPGGRSREKDLVTLSVSVPQAQLLSLSRDQGRLTLILRNPDDVSMTLSNTTTAKDLVETRELEPPTAEGN